MKELYFKVDNQSYKLCTLLPGHTKELWLGKMTATKSMFKKAELINRLDKLKQIDVAFSIDHFKSFVSKSEASTWIDKDSYLFKIV